MRRFPRSSTAVIRRRIVAAVMVAATAVAPLAGSASSPARAAVPSTGVVPPAGYWLVASDGGIFAFGSAQFQGSTGAIHLNQPITGMAATPTGDGYWLVASDGGIFAFGDAGFFGSTGAIRLNKPITGMASTPTGKGYWLVASDGGIFAFGDARFFGSTGAIHLNQPITGMATAPVGTGYWLTAADGGVFAFGDARFYGAAPSRPARGARTIVAMVPSASGAGYWQASTSGELLAFGDAADLGGASNLNKPIVGMAALPGAHTSGDTGGGTTTPTLAGAGTTPSTMPTSPPAGSAPQTFSPAARASWGTPLATDPNNPSSAYGGAEKVASVREAGSHVFVAGEFTNLVDPANLDASGNPVAASPAIPYVAELDVATGAPVPGSALNANAQPDGPVSSIAVSPDGQRLYLAGDFNKIGGQASPKLAALDIATGTLDPTFKPPVPSGHTRALLLNGTTLYVGGGFLSMGASPHALVAAVDASTGALIDSFAGQLVDYGGHFANHSGTPTESTGGAGSDPGTIHDLALTGDGKTLLAGGDFLHLGTSPTADAKHQHGGLVALDPTTGNLTPWQPVNSRPTFGLAPSPTDGQTFFAAEGGAGGMGMAFTIGDPKTTATPRWSSLVDGDAMGVAATPTRVYLVGHFQYLCSAPLVANANGGLSCPPGGVKGAKHNHLAAYYPDTGSTDETFTAAANTPKGPDDVYIGAHDLYVGGDFSQVAPQYDHAKGNFRPQPGLAVFPANG